jgi:aryl-alcohol dehydrogenase-like predicted oxidoreductase
VAPVVGASNAAQIADLMGAVDLQLTRHQVALLDEVSS